jgi:methyl-accepting chemotaxis protein
MSRLSIRAKLLIVFMLLFTVTLSASFYWFYQFATDMVMTDLRQSLMASARTAASLINIDEHTQVYLTGVEGDAQYTQIADQLRLVRDTNPKVAAIYTMVHSDTANELLFVVSADENPETRAHLRSPYDVSDAPEMLAAFNEPTADQEIGSDEYGDWLSGYAPLKDAQGNGVAIVGVDMTAEDVIRAQTGVRNASILAFIIAYLSAFGVVFLLSATITKPLRSITDASCSLERDEPFEPHRLEKVGRGADELAQLARVFSRMAVQVQTREQNLKREVAELRIEIDEVKRQKQVSEIVESDDFRDLQARAHELRRKRAEHSSGGQPPG